MAIAERGFLLDTHTFLWMAAEPARLGQAARERIDDPASVLHLSVATVWEIAIKKSLGKLQIPSSLAVFIEEQSVAVGARLLDVRSAHAARVEHLPWHHRDPFDRLLVSQALVEELALLSADPAFDRYGVERIW